MPSHWGCSNCDIITSAPAENFRGTCRHIVCENCIIGVVNRKKLLTKKTSGRKAAGSSAIEVTCPCTSCRGTIQVSQVWYEEKNSSIISLCDDEEDQGQKYCTAAVPQVKTEIKLKELDDQTVVRKGIERGGLKPLFEKGDAVYALWDESWYPGKILSYKQFDSKSRYGDVREYVVRFDDGDVGSTDDYNVFHHQDYKLFGQNEGEGNWKWKGVKNLRDGRSSDVWAKVVGWYVADIDGKKQKFSTLVSALRAYDASMIKKKGDQTKESDLNLPEEYRAAPRAATPPKRERDAIRERVVDVVTPSSLVSSPPISNDDDESRFSEQEVEERMTKRIKIERDVKIQLPPHSLEGDEKDDPFWSARDNDIEFTEDAFKKKSIFHLNSFVDGKIKRNKGFGDFVEQGIATPCFEKVPEDIAPMIAGMTQEELRDALMKYPDWGWWFGASNSSGAGQVAMWLKRVKVGSFVVMRHEYERCPHAPEWLKERDESSGKLEYIGPVYIIGVVTRKIKPYSEEEAYVQKEMLPFDRHEPLPSLCLVDWKRIGFKDDLKEETQKYINRICQPTVVNICNDFKRVYTDGATAASLRQDLWDSSSPFEFVV
ncbi:hypothetical protein ACHAWT_006204 [Skeletonema menzelii]